MTDDLISRSATPKMRLIDADALKVILNRLRYIDLTLYSSRGFETAMYEINCAPTVDAVPVVHARWVEAHKGLSACRCTACCAVWESETNYCPNCGAKMDEEEPK